MATIINQFEFRITVRDVVLAVVVAILAIKIDNFLYTFRCMQDANSELVQEVNTLREKIKSVGICKMSDGETEWVEACFTK